ncbi:hypothetical protein SAMN05421823_111249 [Catalinimonas alkaloidigena]|uniref:TonB C-terminal domain-containing protein n=1 Tax=Catalinimonas alkaloidigena TaxID=1075417 RepID=A0A1G9RRV9_9BACT|nr:hypothetical protein [Catalinimonas alkaloidigena]SDM26049.1 hypothetical protein SAMN05421823_111249 [Catalinimonas alkaloidigena]
MKTPLLLLMLLSFTTVQAQRAEKAQKPKKEKWQTIYKKHGVTFSYQIVDCDGPEYVACRISNARKKKTALSYTLFTVDAQGERLPLEKSRHLVLKPKQTVQGSCNKPRPELFQPQLLPEVRDITVELDFQALTK